MTSKEIMTRELSKVGWVAVKFSDGFWLTFWDSYQKRRIKSNGPYKTKDEANIDLESLTSREKRVGR